MDGTSTRLIFRGMTMNDTEFVDDDQRQRIYEKALEEKTM